MFESHFQVWDGSAEEEISCAAGLRKGDWGVVADGAGGGIGRGRDADDGGAGRKGLGAERSEDVYDEWALRRFLRGDGGNGQVEGIARDQRVHFGKGDGGISAREKRE